MRSNSVLWTVLAFGLAALATPFELLGLPLAPLVALVLGAVAGWRAALPASRTPVERGLRAGLTVGFGALAGAVVGLVLVGLAAGNLPAVQAFVQNSEPHPEARLPEELIAPLAAFGGALGGLVLGGVDLALATLGGALAGLFRAGRPLPNG